MTDSWRLSPELQDLKERTARFMRDEVLAAEAQIDPEAYELPPHLLEPLQARARELGIWMTGVPAEYGGAGLSLLGQCVVREEAGKCRLGPFLPGAGTIGWNPPPIVFSGTEEQLERFALPAVEHGHHVWTAVTEPQGGGDPARAITTTAVRDGADWVLNGQKMFIGHVGRGPWGIVFVRTGAADSGRAGISCFIVQSDAPGMHLEPLPMIRPGAPALITFEDCRIPGDQLLGEEGEGFKLMQDWVVQARVPYCADVIGVAQAAIEIATKYALERTTFGARLADQQAVQWMLADSEIELRAARLLMYQAAWNHDLGEEFKVDASVAKVYATETAGRVVDRCIQILGARGLLRALPLERWYRELRVKRIGEGPSEVQRLVVARSMLGTARRPAPSPDLPLMQALEELAPHATGHAQSFHHEVRSA